MNQFMNIEGIQGEEKEDLMKKFKDDCTATFSSEDKDYPSV